MGKHADEKEALKAKKSPKKEKERGKKEKTDEAEGSRFAGLVLLAVMMLIGVFFYLFGGR